MKSADRRKMQRHQIKECSVVLDPNEVLRYLCRKPELSDPVYSVSIPPEEAAFVHNILTVVKQEPQDECTSGHFVSTEHIKSECTDDDMELVEESNNFLPQQKGYTECAGKMECTVPLLEEHIKLEGTEQLEDMKILEELKDFLPQQLGNVECVEETECTIPLPVKHINLKDTEYGMKFLEEPKDFLPQTLGNTECAEETDCAIPLPEKHIKLEGTEQDDMVFVEESIDYLTQQSSDTESGEEMKCTVPLPARHIKLGIEEKVPSQHFSDIESDVIRCPSNHGTPDDENSSYKIDINMGKLIERILTEEERTERQEVEIECITVPTEELSAKKCLNFSRISNHDCKNSRDLFKLGVLPSKILQKIKSDVPVSTKILVHVQAKTEEDLKSDSPIVFVDLNGSSHVQGTISKIKLEKLLGTKRVAKMKLISKSVQTISTIKDKKFECRRRIASYNFLCSVCNSYLMTENDNDLILMCDVLEFNLHLDTHFDSVFIECPHCSQDCINIHEYYTHARSCSENLQIERQINFINYVHPGRNNFVKDLWKFECNQCNVTLPNYCSKFIHEAHCSLNFEQLRIFKFNVVTRDSCFKCVGCNAIFQDKCLFQAHCTPSIIFPEALTRCRPCAINFESEQEYIAHVKSEDHVFKCEMCSKNFSGANSYISHKSTEHNVKMIYCSGCSRTVPPSEFHSRHVYYCFLNDTLCVLCGRNYMSFLDLVVHMNLEILRLQFNYQCRKCYNYFCSKFNLCSHMMNSECDHNQFRKNLFSCAKLMVTS